MSKVKHVIQISNMKNAKKRKKSVPTTFGRDGPNRASTKSPKHRIPLLDVLHAKGRNIPGGPIPKHTWSMIEKAKYNAARYVFDEEASAIAGELAIHSPELVIQNRQFAIPPAPMTYVEVNSKAFFSSAEKTVLPLAEADDQLGYLVIGNRVYTLFNRWASVEGLHGSPGISYWSYRHAGIGAHAGAGDMKVKISPDFHQELTDALPRFGDVLGKDPDPERFCKIAVMFGSMADGNQALIHSQVGAMADEWAMDYLDPTFAKSMPEGVPASLLTGFMGDVRNYVSLMLWLSQPQRVRIVGVPGGRHIVRGKSVPYLHHNTVTISLGGCKTVRRAFIIGNERRHPRLHDVKGHFRHRGGYKPCISLDGHDWPLMPDERGHWICKTCGRERWHVDKHVRGTAELGVVTKDYSIIP
jgi:hypothetical protein